MSSWTRVVVTSLPFSRDNAMMAGTSSGDVLLFGGFTSSYSTYTSTVTMPSGTYTASAPAYGYTAVASSANAAFTSVDNQLAEAFYAGSGSIIDPGLTSEQVIQSGATWVPPAAGGDISVTENYYTTVTSQTTYNTIYANDTWLWNGSQWIQQFPQTTPVGRKMGMMAYNPSTGQTVLFGGINENNLYDPSTWLWNGTNWVNANPSTSPPSRAEGVLFYDPVSTDLILFGGMDAASSLADTWSWNGTTWTELSPTSAPSARFGAMATTNSTTNNVVLFGGQIASGFASDTWEWNGSDWVEQSPATIPTARAQGLLGYDATGDSTIMFGGNSDSGVLNDTWLWNGQNWIELTPYSPPPARYNVAGATSPNGRLVMFGGTNGSSITQYFADLWQFYADIIDTTYPSISTSSMSAKPTILTEYYAQTSAPMHSLSNPQHNSPTDINQLIITHPVEYVQYGGPILSDRMAGMYIDSLSMVNVTSSQSFLMPVDTFDVLELPVTVGGGNGADLVVQLYKDVGHPIFPYDQYALSLDPVAYLPLSEAEGASIAGSLVDNGTATITPTGSLVDIATNYPTTYSTNGTVQGTSNFGQGSPSSAYPQQTSFYFDGSTDISLAYPGPSGSSFTVSMWINPGPIQPPNFGTRLYRTGAAGNTTGIDISLTGTAPYGIGFDIAYTPYNTAVQHNVVYSSTTVPADTWTMVTCVYDGNNLIIYINGQQSGIQEIGAATVEPGFGAYLGSAGGGGDPYEGYMSSVFVSDNALNADQVLALYESINSTSVPINYNGMLEAQTVVPATFIASASSASDVGYYQSSWLMPASWNYTPTLQMPQSLTGVSGAATTTANTLAVVAGGASLGILTPNMYYAAFNGTNGINAWLVGPTVPLPIADSSMTFLADSSTQQQGFTNGTLYLVGGITQAIAAPGTPSVTPSGTLGTTTYWYKVTAVNSGGETNPSAPNSTLSGNATLSTTDFNILNWPTVSNASSYNVYRSTNNIDYELVANTSNTTYNDIGVAAQNISPPLYNRALAPTANVYTSAVTSNSFAAWQSTQSLPVALTQVGLTSIGSTILVIGGFDGTNAVNTVYAAQDSGGSVNAWLELTPLPEAITNPQVAVLNNWVVVSNTDQSVLYASQYNPTTQTISGWQSWPTPPMSAYVLVAADDTLVATGGYDVAGLAVSPNGPSPQWMEYLNVFGGANVEGLSNVSNLSIFAFRQAFTPTGQQAWSIMLPDLSIVTSFYEWAILPLPLPADHLHVGTKYHLVLTQQNGSPDNYLIYSLVDNYTQPVRITPAQYPNQRVSIHGSIPFRLRSSSITFPNVIVDQDAAAWTWIMRNPQSAILGIGKIVEGAALQTYTAQMLVTLEQNGVIDQMGELAPLSLTTAIASSFAALVPYVDAMDMTDTLSVETSGDSFVYDANDTLYNMAVFS